MNHSDTYRSWKVLLCLGTALSVGVSLMISELVGSLLLSPRFGSGLQVWSTLLGLILLGLFMGYLLGSALSRFGKKAAILASGLLLGGGWLAIAAQYPGFFQAEMGQGSEFQGLIFTTLSLVGVPSLSLGLISPLLVGWMSLKLRLNPGRASGQVLASSTLGSVLAAFGAAFLGLDHPGPLVLLWGSAALLLICALLWTLLLYRRWLSLMALALLILTLAGSFPGPQHTHPDLRYQQISLQGERLVIDLPLNDPFSVQPSRVLLMNRIAQTYVDRRNWESRWPYVHTLSTLSSHHPPGSRVLLLGLAGGSLANELVSLGFEVTAVDIDSEAGKIARQYFNLSSEVKFVADDARHFLETEPEQYDLILMDLFAGEGQPDHLFSLEAFRLLRSRISPQGELMINFHGFSRGEAGAGARAVFKTLELAGWEAAWTQTPGIPSMRNTLFLASVENLMMGSDRKVRQADCCRRRSIPLYPPLSRPSPTELLAAVVLTDEQPRLELLNAEAYQSWRSHAVEHYLLPLEAEGISIF